MMIWETPEHPEGECGFWTIMVYLEVKTQEVPYATYQMLVWCNHVYPIGFNFVKITVICACAFLCLPRGVYVGERTTFGSHFSPFYCVAPGAQCQVVRFGGKQPHLLRLLPASYWLWWYKLCSKENYRVFGLSKEKTLLWEWVEL
jgi:hypothetical protein